MLVHIGDRQAVELLVHGLTQIPNGPLDGIGDGHVG